MENLLLNFAEQKEVEGLWPRRTRHKWNYTDKII